METGNNFQNEKTLSIRNSGHQNEAEMKEIHSCMSEFEFPIHGQFLH